MTEKISYGYIRVSTNMQKEDGISLDTQKKLIEDYCLYKHMDLKKIYSDAGKSAGTMDREALQILLTMISKGTYIIVAELSRLSRNATDALNILTLIKKKGGYLISLNPDIDFSSPIGQMMYTMLSGFHELERSQISERVSKNMQNLSKQKKLRGKPPYGWKFISKEKEMIEDQEQQEVKKIIKEMYEIKKNLSKIANYLNENGYTKTLKKPNQKFDAYKIKCILSDDGIIKTKRKKIEERFLGIREKNI
jgi:site-specific DNA recombinase